MNNTTFLVDMGAKVQVITAVEYAAAWLHVNNVAIPDDLAYDLTALKADMRRRDKREPGRDEKEKAERRIFGLLRRRFKAQLGKVTERLDTMPRAVKRGDADVQEWIELFDDEDAQAQLLAAIAEAARRGVALFSDGTNLQIDYSLTNAEASKWATEYTYELIGAHRQKDGTLKLGSLDQVTLDVVRQAVDMFVNNPGMTIGDVTKILPFGEDRALKIATTEITRAYAQGQQMAGEELKKEYPDVRVVKTWYTNNDDRVCEICGPLDGQTVDVDAEFDQDVYYPPAHVNCRCWIATSTEST